MFIAKILGVMKTSAWGRPLENLSLVDVKHLKTAVFIAPGKLFKSKEKIKQSLSFNFNWFFTGQPSTSRNPQSGRSVDIGRRLSTLLTLSTSVFTDLFITPKILLSLADSFEYRTIKKIMEFKKVLDNFLLGRG